MKKIKIIEVSLGIIGISLTIVFVGNKLICNNKDNYLMQEERKSDTQVYSTGISMMLETKYNSGEYKETIDTTWKEAIEKGYIFNETRSTCENGSTLTWNETNQTVTFSGNVSDKCYVYFDKLSLAQVCTNQQMGSCIAANYRLDSSIYYHDGEGTYSKYEAEDNSYRYSGANPDNYVCFGDDCTNDDNLYRIIGIFDNKVKLIKEDIAQASLIGSGQKYGTFNKSDFPNYKENKTSIDIFYWSGSGTDNENTWISSTLNTVALNTTFLTNIGESWADKIFEATWKVGGNTWFKIGTQNAKTAYTNEITNAETNEADGKTEDTFKVGLMYVSDYMYAASPKYWNYNGYAESADYRMVTNDNWLYKGINEWTITRRFEDSDLAFAIFPFGYVYAGNVHQGGYAVRPCFYLNSSVTLIGGNGSASDPYRIS